MALGTHVILVAICQLIYISGITSYRLQKEHTDHNIREVVVRHGIGQTVECPGLSRIIILLTNYLVHAMRQDTCGNDFYEFYVSRRCSYKHRCEFPRFVGSTQDNCPTRRGVKVRYKCILGKEIIRATKLSPRQTLSMDCPFNTSIRLVEAEHKTENCYYRTAFPYIDESCRYKKGCTVEYKTIPEMWKCDELGIPEEMEIDYKCQKHSVHIVSAVKGESLSIQCSGGQMIDIQSANYSSGTGKCFDFLAELTVNYRCSTKNSCSFPDDVSKYFMNFCHQGKRRLEVAYSCIRVEDTKNFIVFQDGMLDLACDRGKLIKIVSAKYGHDDFDCWSVMTQTNMIKECEGKTTCCAAANDKFLGTPSCPRNIRKSLTVIYQCQAITDFKTLENTALKGREGKRCEKIRFELAASFGEITSESLQTLDRDLLIMIGGSLPKLKEMSAKTFDDVIRYMKNIEFLAVNDDSYVERSDSFNNSKVGIMDLIDLEFAKFQAVVWYRTLIGNRDILSEAHIDIDRLSDFVTTIGASAHSLSSSVFRREGRNETVVDMAILRFPDYRRPFFMIYNIKLMAWWKTSRLLVFQKARSGMSGQFRSMKFLPNHEFIRNSKKELIEEALNEANSLFEMPQI